MSKVDFSDVIKFEDENFKVDIEYENESWMTRPRWALKVTHNGNQWSTIALHSLAELEEVREKLYDAIVDWLSMNV